MIKASEARDNIKKFEIEQYNKIKTMVEEALEVISTEIEFHSKNGLNTAEFVPYDASRFPSYRSVQIASEIFERILKDNGYEIITNDRANNILKIKW